MKRVLLVAVVVLSAPALLHRCASSQDDVRPHRADADATVRRQRRRQRRARASPARPGLLSGFERGRLGGIHIRAWRNRRYLSSAARRIRARAAHRSPGVRRSGGPVP